MKKISKPCFSNGTEAEFWLACNCDRCVKASRLINNNGDYTKCRCAVQRDIITQMMGYGNEEINERSYEATQKVICPYKQEHHKPRKKKDNDKSLSLF